MGKIPCAKNEFLGTKNKLRLQKWCKFTENSGSVASAKIRILKVHDELASLAHCQQAPETLDARNGEPDQPIFYGHRISRAGDGCRRSCKNDRTL